MVLETPLLRVSRPVAACSRCRSAKVKCDGKLPACTACEKSNRASECSSTNDQFARGKERSYVATLESRVERLEKRILEAKARRQSSIFMLDVDPVSTPHANGTANGAPPRSNRAARRKEAFDIDSLVSDFGYLAVNATARDFYGFTSSMSYSRLILASGCKKSMAKQSPLALPPRFAATPLLQHYMNTIFILVPVLEEASLYASLDAVYHSDVRKATPFDHLTIRMVLALANISQSVQLDDAHYRDAVGHVKAALEYAGDVLHPGVITNIQALVLLVQYAIMDPHHFDSWELIGAASRAMVDIGMHHDPSKSARVPKNKLELRRRVYHCIYVLDRATTFALSRSFSFSDNSAHVAMPFSTSATSPPGSEPTKNFLWLQSFDAALDLIRLRQIQSQAYTDLFQTSHEVWSDPYSYIWKTYHTLTDWFSKLAVSTLPSIRSYFETELLYSYVYILAPNSRCPTPSIYAQRLIFEHSTVYATNLLALVSAPPTAIKPPSTSYDILQSYTIGRKLIEVLSGNVEEMFHAEPPVQIKSSPTDSQRSFDPLAPPTEVYAPPLPAPAMPASANLHSPPPPPNNPYIRAIEAIDDITSILTQLGTRFGSIHWRDRFQQESATILGQLHQQAALAIQRSQSLVTPPLSQHQQLDLGPDYRMWVSTPSALIPPPLPVSSAARTYQLSSPPNVTMPYTPTTYATHPSNAAEWQGQPQLHILRSQSSPHQTSPPRHTFDDYSVHPRT